MRAVQYELDFIYKNLSQFLQKVVPLFLHILFTPLYTITIVWATSLCLKKVCGCSSSHCCTKSVASWLALNPFLPKAPLSELNR
jgi:TRAP-type mannitol/chloroaromatic compound transport system permease small subunit